MIGVMRTAARAIAAAFFLIAALGAAHAAGALAVGTCGAYGYGYDFRKVADARAAAIRKCTGNGCKVVGTIRRGCAAMAVDAKNPCGSFGSDEISRAIKPATAPMMMVQIIDMVSPFSPYIFMWKRTGKLV